MLTSLYYYGFYKPYIVRETSSAPKASSVSARRSPKAAESTRAESVLLNKTLKSDVVAYARNASASVTGLRGAAGRLSAAAERFGRSARENGLDETKNAFAKRAETFAEVFNTAKNFTQEQQHSEALRGYGRDAETLVSAYEQELNAIGFKKNENGALVFNRETTADMDAATIQWALGDAEPLFKELYALSNDMLTEPLASHMQFKGFGFYYNYKLGKVQDNTFQMIEAGMIADYAV